MSKLESSADDKTSEILVQFLFNRNWFKGGTPRLELPDIEVSSDPKTLLQADCVVMHLPSLLTTNHASKFSELKRVVPAKQIWISLSLESAANYPASGDPSFLQLFDGEFSFRQSADVWTPYLPKDFTVQTIGKRPYYRRGRCCAFISSDFNASGQLVYLNELMQHMPLASYGRVRRNRHIWFDRGRSSKLATLRRFDFSLAFENCIENDYVTEKFFDPLLAGSVPIYLGAPNIDEFAPGDDCYVNANGFPGPTELAQFLKDADVGPFQAWRQRPLRPGFMEKLARLQISSESRMANFIRQRVEARRQSQLVHP